MQQNKLQNLDYSMDKVEIDEMIRGIFYLTSCFHLCDDCNINLLCDIKNFIIVQIQMNNSNVLLVHIKCQMLYARVQIYHPSHMIMESCLAFNKALLPSKN
jgi:hypothetical protein